MRRTVIALRGRKNSGKTTTIRLAYEDLARQALAGRIVDSGRGVRRSKEVKGAILEVEGVLIGIASPGDLPSMLRNYLQKLVDAGCVIIVCATHSGRCETVRVVEQLPDCEIVWIEKACPEKPDHDSQNRRRADDIISEVRKAISMAQLVEA